MPFGYDRSRVSVYSRISKARQIKNTFDGRALCQHWYLKKKKKPRTKELPINRVPIVSIITSERYQTNRIQFVSENVKRVHVFGTRWRRHTLLVEWWHAGGIIFTQRVVRIVLPCYRPSRYQRSRFLNEKKTDYRFVGIDISNPQWSYKICFILITKELGGDKRWGGTAFWGGSRLPWLGLRDYAFWT